MVKGFGGLLPYDGDRQSSGARCASRIPLREVPVADEKHLYVTVGGSYVQSVNEPEGWQCGFRMALVFGSVDDEGTLPNNWDVTPNNDTQTLDDWTITSLCHIAGPLGDVFEPGDYLHDQVIPYVTTFMEAEAISSQCNLEWVKVSPINTLGHVVSLRNAYATTTSPVPGGLSSNLLPLQNSVVVSTRTGTPGRRGRGRFYLPGVGVNAMAATGLLATANQGVIRDAAVALIEGLAYSSSTGPIINVRPIVTGKPYTDYSVIQSIQVGNVIDTQRRRRKSLVETRIDGAVSY